MKISQEKALSLLSKHIDYTGLFFRYNLEVFNCFPFYDPHGMKMLDIQWFDDEGVIWYIEKLDKYKHLWM